MLMHLQVWECKHIAHILLSFHSPSLQPTAQILLLVTQIYDQSQDNKHCSHSLQLNMVVYRIINLLDQQSCSCSLYIVLGKLMYWYGQIILLSYFTRPSLWNSKSKTIIWTFSHQYAATQQICVCPSPAYATWK